MSPQRFRKKPVVIEAVQFDGGTGGEIVEWVRGHSALISRVEDEHGASLAISTLEGTMRAAANDWIICGVRGEFYPCKPDIVDATYEPA